MDTFCLPQKVSLRPPLRVERHRTLICGLLPHCTHATTNFRPVARDTHALSPSSSPPSAHRPRRFHRPCTTGCPMCTASDPPRRFAWAVYALLNPSIVRWSSPAIVARESPWNYNHYSTHTAYFVITNPARSTQWAQGTTHQLTWEKGLLDGEEGYDVELTRMSKDELILVAKNVPAKPPALNVYIDNLPAGDDYVWVSINGTHGVLQGTSERFGILASGKSETASSTAIQVDKTCDAGSRPEGILCHDAPYAAVERG